MQPINSGYLYEEGMILSPDGHCRAFDATAQGTVPGDGVGVVILKRLEEAVHNRDSIYAVIKGFAVNNDGANKIGYTAPSFEGQVKVITEAQNMAEISPADITYIETHGTGTPLGDSIEISALKESFSQHAVQKQSCAIGSVKTNIGHLNTAAGIAGLIKTALCLKHRVLPPTLHFQTANANLAIDDSPFYVNSALIDWKTDEKSPRIAGVSAFGVGGTNAHAVLEEAPIIPPAEVKTAQRYHLLLFSASTLTGLATAKANFASYLKTHSGVKLDDVAYTLQLGRKSFSQRGMLVSKSSQEALEVLGQPEETGTDFLTSEVKLDKGPPVIFLFAEQSTQLYTDMAIELYQYESVFRAEVDKCTALLLTNLQIDIRAAFSSELILQQQSGAVVAAQTVLFVIEYAMAKLWMDWGIQPRAMFGYGTGEYVAACLTGILSLENALQRAAGRSDQTTVIQSIDMQTISQVPDAILLDVGLEETLIDQIKQQATLNKQTVLASFSCLEGVGSAEGRLLCTVGKLWLAGIELDWKNFNANRSGRRIALPTYPFERKRYWIDTIIQPSESIKQSTLPISGQSNDVEGQLIEIWRDYFGVDKVHKQSDFFELGGDSLLAIRFVAEIKNKTQMTILPHELLSAPTPASLAQHLTSKQVNIKTSGRTLPFCLVTLQNGDDELPPVFLIHAAGGNVHFYYSLVAHLNIKQSIYGIQAQGIDGQTDPNKSVVQMAHDYIQAIRCVQASGPYYLIGSSFGGILAYEMAQQLHQNNEHVAFLVMLDSPGCEPSSRRFYSESEIIAYTLSLTNQTSVNPAFLEQLDSNARLNFFLKHSGSLAKSWQGEEIEQLRRYLMLYQASVMALMDYQPLMLKDPRSIVAYFRAVERDTFSAPNPEHFWQALLGTRLTVHAAGGNHLTMLMEPHVKTLAINLKKTLDIVNQ